LLLHLQELRSRRPFATVAIWSAVASAQQVQLPFKKEWITSKAILSTREAQGVVGKALDKIFLAAEHHSDMPIAPQNPIHEHVRNQP
jgi:hypothetical protein